MLFIEAMREIKNRNRCQTVEYSVREQPTVPRLHLKNSLMEVQCYPQPRITKDKGFYYRHIPITVSEKICR